MRAARRRSVRCRTRAPAHEATPAAPRPRPHRRTTLRCRRGRARWRHVAESSTPRSRRHFASVGSGSRGASAGAPSSRTRVRPPGGGRHPVGNRRWPPTVRCGLDPPVVGPAPQARGRDAESLRGVLERDQRDGSRGWRRLRGSGDLAWQAKRTRIALTSSTSIRKASTTADRTGARARRSRSRARPRSGSPSDRRARLVSASKTSATAASRPISGISSPTSPRGYPSPSKCSWCVHAIVAACSSTSMLEPLSSR